MRPHHQTIGTILVPSSGAVHLVGHAAYKALLFMALGLVLHTGGVQDSRLLMSISLLGRCCGVTITTLYLFA